MYIAYKTLDETNLEPLLLRDEAVWNTRQEGFGEKYKVVEHQVHVKIQDE